MTAAAAEPAADAGAKRTDPLVLLRRCTTEGKKVRLLDEHTLELDGHRLPRTAPCGLVLSPLGPFVDIGSVWYMFKEISGDKPYTQDTAKKRGFKYIGVAHRGDLCDYLVGLADWCDGLVREVIEGRKRPRDMDNAPRSKRIRAAAGKAAAGQAPPGGAAPGGGPEVTLHAARDVKTGEISYADVVARVRPVKDLDVLVRCPGRTVPNADLILRIAQDEVNNWHVRPRISRPLVARAGGTPLIKELEARAERDPSARPIILVPCNKQAPVNILNCHDLLEGGSYDKLDMARIQWFEGTRPEYVLVKRNIGGREWEFELRDITAHFTKSQWLSVVAVITDGTDWQFKGWPFESVVDLFTTIKGLFFLVSGKLAPAHVIQWAVSILEMSTLEYQHRFAELRDAFWVEVEKFLNSSRSRKFVNHTTLDFIQLTSMKNLPVL